MAERRFPVAREDGSLAVAACFESAGRDERAQVERFVRQWLTTPNERLQLDVVAELGTEPRVTDGEEGVVRVVFEAKPGSRFWKDILVRFTADAREAMTLRFTGFFDVVAGRYHPGSLHG